MAKLNFKLKSLKVKPVKKVYMNKITGIIKYVKGELFVLYNDKLYPITKESFNCDKKEFVYRKNPENNKRFCISRPKESRVNNIGYIPFIPGHIIKGDIVNINDTLYVSVIDINRDEITEDSHKEFINWIKEYNNGCRKV